MNWGRAAQIVYNFSDKFFLVPVVILNSKTRSWIVPLSLLIVTINGYI
jgi:hypothetical protein